jgi:hypothetical protein
LIDFNHIHGVVDLPPPWTNLENLSETPQLAWIGMSDHSVPKRYGTGIG